MMHLKLNVAGNSPVEASRPYFIIILIGMLLPTLACSAANSQLQFNNEVRLAVFDYEQEMRGPIKDLVIHFQRDEPRVKFEGQNQKGGHTVWLYSAGAAEYFATRPQEAAYLYIQEIEYNADQSAATVNVYRGNGAGYQGWQLTLIRNAANHWMVSEEIAIEGSR